MAADKNIKVNDDQLTRFDKLMISEGITEARHVLFEKMLKSFEKPVKQEVATMSGNNKLLDDIEKLKKELAEAQNAIADLVIKNSKLKADIKERVDFEIKNTKYFPTKHSEMINDCRNGIKRLVDEIN